jgi:hypothetical protein
VDGFLYGDDTEIDQLCESGHMSRSFCGDCHSKNIEDLSKQVSVISQKDFISHSATVAQLKFIFSKDILGDLSGKTVVDVGSRLGAVLYVVLR